MHGMSCYAFGERSIIKRNFRRCLIHPISASQKEHDAFVLKSRDFADLGSYDQVQDHTSGILTSLNGAAKLSLGSGSPIKIGSISEIRGDGTRHAYITMTSSIMVSATCSVTVIHADGTIGEDRPAAPVITWFGALEERCTCQVGLALSENDFCQGAWPGLL